MNPDRPLLAAADRIDLVRFFPPDESVAASVVIVTFRVGRAEFSALLEALARQTTDAFEIVVVDNGTDWDVESAVRSHGRGGTYVRLRRNYGVTFARNLGAAVATAPTLIFLDDDAIPAADFVERHVTVHERRPGVVAVRGRVEPITDTLYNRMQRHRAVDDESIPYLIDIEGNTSFDREAFLEHGGYNERLEGRAGHEGPELTYRMLTAGVDAEAVRYHPGPVIYHDYATSLRGFFYKRAKNREAEWLLRREHPDLFEFVDRFEGDRRDGDLGPPERAAAFALAVAAGVVARIWTALTSR